MVIFQSVLVGVIATSCFAIGAMAVNSKKVSERVMGLLVIAWGVMWIVILINAVAEG